MNVKTQELMSVTGASILQVLKESVIHKAVDGTTYLIKKLAGSAPFRNK
jgi:hypothetical protein